MNKYDPKKAFEYENGFILTSQPFRIGNILAHYELYKKIVHLPGNIVELGVFKGNSLIQFATFRELLENEKSRKIIGFDMFGEFPITEKVESDKKFISHWNNVFENHFLSDQEILDSLSLKNIGNVSLVKGDILQTLPDYIKQYPHEKIALLHIDVDVYEPSKLALELLFDKVVPNGVIILDDYGTVEGETVAVDEFLKEHPHDIKKFSFSHTKPSYIVKK